MLSLYNSLTRSKVPFSPITAGVVRMYVCGMTVYDYCHIGHARVMVVFDMVARWLRQSGYRLQYVRNITDIDDKIIQRANANNESIYTLTQRFIDAMNEDAAQLGVLPPDAEPRATNYVPQMLSLITELMARGLAYQADNGDVCYAVRKFSDYGKLSGKSLEDLRAGERVAVADGKRDPLDFVLWKRARMDEPDEVKWDSPWGRGRPGWHIECSAMSNDLLGEHFDIHGGGQDLQFPHHENEIAQSAGAHAGKFANYWLHNGFVRIDDEKMSKSLGNFFTIREVLKTVDAEVLRFFILRAHYRSPLNYSDVHLEDARAALTRLYTALKPYAHVAPAVDWQLPRAVAFAQAMNDDFGTSEALAVLFDLANELNRQPKPTASGAAENAALLKGLGAVLGLLQRDAQTFLQSAPSTPVETSEHLTPAAIDALVSLRLEARRAKNFTEADRIRAQLSDLGIVLEDGPQGSSWRRA